MEKSRTTLDQWITLQAVVDYGGFAQAANVLHRTQSSVSYTINKLEQTLGIEILSLEKRRAVLTSEGELLLELSREITEKALLLEKQAKNIRSNNKLRINILVDPLYISGSFLYKISLFIKQNKQFDLDINKKSLNKADISQKRDYDLIITHHHIASLQPMILDSIETVFVTHPESPLQKCSSEDLFKELQKHSFISLISDSRGKENNHQVIQVGTVETALSLIQHGLGYSQLPLSLIEKELNENKLKILNIPNKETEYRFYLYLNKNSLQAEQIKNLLSMMNEK